MRKRHVRKHTVPYRALRKHTMRKIHSAETQCGNGAAETDACIREIHTVYGRERERERERERDRKRERERQRESDDYYHKQKVDLPTSRVEICILQRANIITQSECAHVDRPIRYHYVDGDGDGTRAPAGRPPHRALLHAEPPAHARLTARTSAGPPARSPSEIYQQ